ncbi:M48 family metallopeptidase [Nocardiopsis aegyptia]|uniref:Zn-dependent protease with chaperone function n=1 Tax=Nocardiopsis aegyptia TaxID=220378 RepID=A0A7Z0JB10_9ACTN|nr:M48 family metallopeptidase [Nocardiopsis aegyptia]NYJ35716.1 Zn-dependent protease with chaperone function [Nocardiopsis aegyptia]
MSHAIPPQGHATCSTHGAHGCSATSGRGAHAHGGPGPRTSHGHTDPSRSLDADEELLPAPAHPWEVPLLVVCSVVNLVVVAAFAYAVWSVSGSPWWTAGASAAVPVGLWAARGLRYARQRAESVKISPTQFPEAYRMVASLSVGMGLSRVPEAYVRAGGEHWAARTDAGGHRLHRYLVLPNDLFEVGERLRDPDAVAFLIAHQLGHVAAGHTGFWRRLATLGAHLVPGLGAALSRTMEYTADNHAFTHCPQGVHAVRLHAGGKHLYARVNMGEMADRARTDRGLSLLVYHLLSRRPSNTRRMAALRDRARRGRVFL